MWKDLPTLEEIRGRLAKEIYKKLKYEDNSFIVAITGPTGSGKSQYAMKIAYQFYRDWDLVLSNIIFTPFELEERFNELKRKNEKIPILIWDDAGPWMRIMKNAPWDPLTVSVLGHLETMRLRVGCLILTLTTDKHMPRGLYENGYIYRYRTRVWKNGYDHKRNEELALAVTVERKESSDWGKFYWDNSNIIRDHLRLNVPVYGKYRKMRDAYTEVYNEVMEAAKRHSKAAVSLTVAHEKWKQLREVLAI